MTRFSTQFREHRGQTLVWVAIMLVVLMGFVGLAVDGGSLLSERRAMQNAADAAALEAARARCFDDSTVAQAITKAQTFATTNYNPRPFIVSSVAYTVTQRGNNAWEFAAVAAENVNLQFAKLLGLGPISVRAAAAAACGPTTQACGVFPLAFSQPIWDPIQNQCGQTFYVWTGEQDSGAQGANPPSCSVCDCTKVYDNQKNQIPGVLALPDVGRAWLDFTSAGSSLNPVDCGGSNGCGAAELKCWIVADTQTVVLTNSCVSGTTGVKLGVKNSIATRNGDYVNIPLFNGRCAPAAQNGNVCDVDGFNVSGFGCVQVQLLESQSKSLAWKVTPTPAAHGNYNPCMSTNPGAPGCKMCLEEKMLPVKVGCDPATGVSMCETSCGRTNQGGNPGAGVRAVSLIQ